MRDGALADTSLLTSQWHVFLLATSRIGRKVKTESFSAVSAANGGAKIFVPNFSVSGCDLFFSL